MYVTARLALYLPKCRQRKVRRSAEPTPARWNSESPQAASSSNLPAPSVSGRYSYVCLGLLKCASCSCSRPRALKWRRVPTRSCPARHPTKGLSATRSAANNTWAVEGSAQVCARPASFQPSQFHNLSASSTPPPSTSRRRPGVRPTAAPPAGPSRTPPPPSDRPGLRRRTTPGPAAMPPTLTSSRGEP